MAKIVFNNHCTRIVRHSFVHLKSRYDSTEPGLDIIFDTETSSHQYWHKMQLLAKGGTYVLLGLLARSLNDPWDKVNTYCRLCTVNSEIPWRL